MSTTEAATENRPFTVDIPEAELEAELFTAELRAAFKSLRNRRSS